MVLTDLAPLALQRLSSGWTPSFLGGILASWLWAPFGEGHKQVSLV